DLLGGGAQSGMSQLDELGEVLAGPTAVDDAVAQVEAASPTDRMKDLSPGAHLPPPAVGLFSRQEPRAESVAFSQGRGLHAAKVYLRQCPPQRQPQLGTASFRWSPPWDWRPPRAARWSYWPARRRCRPNPCRGSPTAGRPAASAGRRAVSTRGWPAPSAGAPWRGGPSTSAWPARPLRQAPRWWWPRATERLRASRPKAGAGPSTPPACSKMCLGPAPGCR